jgi:S-formylglutathione hydrolase
LHDQSPAYGGSSLAAQLETLGPLLDAAELSAIAPAAPDAWWCDRRWAPFSPEVSTERWVVEAVWGAICQRLATATPRVALVGLGMGGQAALRLAYRRPERFPVTAGVDPLIDFHRLWESGHRPLQQLYGDAEEARQDTATLHIHPLNWPRNQWFGGDAHDYLTFEGIDRLRMKLYSLGVPYACDEATPPGAPVAARLAAALAFVRESLRRERARVS